MTSKLSRSALIAAVAMGVSGLVAVPAEAANGVSTASYYVNSPAVTGASNITPESATLSASVDTGGGAASELVVGSGATLTWNPNFNITGPATGYVDGLPASDSNDPVIVTITDSACTGVSTVCDGLTSGTAGGISNAGADNYSEVYFWYDPASDYVANGDAPGQDTIYSSEQDVPTVAGVPVEVSSTVGGYPAASAEDNGQTPLTPNTTYYYGLDQNAGVTDAAEDINIAQWANQTTNPTYKCYPEAAIAADPTLSSYNSSTEITFDGTTAPAIQGTCTYYYGNTSGALVYQSTVGTFRTPSLGKITFGGTALVTRGTAADTVTDYSSEPASGSVQLTAKVKGKTVTFASGSFHVAAGGTDPASFKLSKKGLSILDASKRGKQSVKVVLTSNTDQPSKTKSLTLELS